MLFFFFKDRPSAHLIERQEICSFIAGLKIIISKVETVSNLRQAAYSLRCCAMLEFGIF